MKLWLFVATVACLNVGSVAYAADEVYLRCKVQGADGERDDFLSINYSSRTLQYITGGNTDDYVIVLPPNDFIIAHKVSDGPRSNIRINRVTGEATFRFVVPEVAKQLIPQVRNNSRDFPIGEDVWSGWDMICQPERRF